MADKENRINREITGNEIRLLGAEGEQLGVTTVAAALRMAEDAQLDLVEIAPLAKPPVCRIMDYGKFKYREAKQQHEAKLKQKQIQVKEIKMRPGTDEGDYQIKLRKMQEFIAEGDKVKVSLRFRGREMAHQEFGLRQLNRVKEDMAELIVVEQFPKLEGRQMVMMIAPKKKDTKEGKESKVPKEGRDSKPNDSKQSANTAKAESAGTKKPDAPKPQGGAEGAVKQ